MRANIWLVCVPAFLIAFAGTWFMRWIAPRLGLMDQPDPRKVHQRAVPLGGGVAIWFSVVTTLGVIQILAWLISKDPSRQSWVPMEYRTHLPGMVAQSAKLGWIMAAGTVVMLLGLLDDRYQLGFQIRLVIQVLVCTGLVLGGVRLTLFMDYSLFTGVLTVFWMVSLINAFNFLDNMDGLSGGVATIAATLLAVVMIQAGDQPHWFVSGFLVVLAGAILGFLVHNWYPARIFMGDAGSCFLGLMLSVSTVLGTFHEPGMPKHAVIAPLCVLAVPLYDAVSVIGIRIYQGRSPFLPDKNHFSHRLVSHNLSPRAAVLTIYLTTFATGLGALLLYRIEHWTGAVVVSMIVLCVLGIIAILEMAASRSQKK